MKAIWVDLCRPDTLAMEVPGGVLIRHDVNKYEDARTVCQSTSLVFVPNVHLDCSKEKDTGEAELIGSSSPSAEPVTKSENDVVEKKVECPSCEGGHTPAWWALCKMMDLVMIAGEDVGRPVALHPLLRSVGIKSLSTDIAELSSALAGRSAARPGGHDVTDTREAVKKVVQAAGLPATWGTCKLCGGLGKI